MLRKLILLIAITSLVLMTIPESNVRAATWYIGPNPLCVDGSTPTDFPDVATALADPTVLDGDILTICENLVESTPQLDITKSVVITSNFGPFSQDWILEDTDDTNYALGILADVTFLELDFTVRSTALTNFDYYVHVSGATLFIVDSVVFSEFKSAGTLIHVGGSSLEVIRSVFFDPNNATNVPVNFIDLVNADLNVDTSSLYLFKNGYVVNATYDGLVDPNFGISFNNSYVRSFDNILRVEGTNTVLGVINITSNTFTASNYPFYIEMSGGSQLDFNIVNSSFNSWKSDGLYASISGASYMTFTMDPSLGGVTGYVPPPPALPYIQSVINVSVTGGSAVDAFIFDSILSGQDDNALLKGINIFLDTGSMMYLELDNVSFTDDFNFMSIDDSVFLDANGGSLFIMYALDSTFIGNSGDGLDVNIASSVANIFLENSSMRNISSDAVDIFIELSSVFDLYLERVDVDTWDFIDGTISDSEFTIQVNESNVFTGDEGIDLNIDPSSGLILISESMLDIEEEVIYFGNIWDSNVSIMVLNSVIESDDEDLLESFDIINSNLDVLVAGSDIDVWDEFIDLTFQDSSVDIDVYESFIHADRIGVYLDSSLSLLNLSITDSVFDSWDESIDIWMSSSIGNMNISYSVLDSASANEMDIYAGVASQFDVYTEFSVIGTFSITGGDTFAYFFETVYNEINSYRDPGDVVFSTWTIEFQINSTNGYPLPGAIVNVFQGATPLGSTVAGAGGKAYFTVSYFYDPLNPFINQLVFTANYKGRTNTTPYTLFEDRFTMPSWYGNITILIKLFVFKAQLAGHIGFGTLDIEGRLGMLSIGSPISGGWMNTYTVFVNSVSTTENYMVITFSVFYDGNWVQGYIFANTNSGLVYMRFGGVELYGSMRR